MYIQHWSCDDGSCVWEAPDDYMEGTLTYSPRKADWEVEGYGIGDYDFDFETFRPYMARLQRQHLLELHARARRILGEDRPWGIVQFGPVIVEVRTDEAPERRRLVDLLLDPDELDKPLGMPIWPAHLHQVVDDLWKILDDLEARDPDDGWAAAEPRVLYASDRLLVVVQVDEWGTVVDRYLADPEKAPVPRSPRWRWWQGPIAEAPALWSTYNGNDKRYVEVS